MGGNEQSEHSPYSPFSLRQRVFRLLEKNHELKPMDLCKLLDENYRIHGATVKQYRKQWKREYRNRQALKCLSFHNTRGWVYALKVMPREKAADESGVFWVQTKARNKMLLWKDLLGRLEWHLSGRINIWVKKPATWGRVKQLLANAFFQTGLLMDIQVFDLWANSARFKGSHLVYDTGERLPYAKIEYLKGSLGVVVKTGDVTHPTAIELEFTYPDFEERNERVLEQNSKILEQNLEAMKEFRDVMKDLSQPKIDKVKPDFYG